MANIKSRNKQVRKSRLRKGENNVVRKKLKTSLKQYHTAINNNDKDQAEILLQKTVSLLDRSYTKNAHNKNFVNRHKSRLHKAYNSL